MKKLFYILFIALIVQNSYTQSSIQGKVLSTNTETLEFVNVVLRTSKDSSMVKGSITDSTGTFVFENVETGNYFIEASMVGFGNGQSALIFHDGNTDSNIKELTLQDGIQLSEVIVTATKPFIEMKADKIVVNVANSSVSAGNNALEVLQKSPGVTVDKDNNISLKGKQGVLVTIDGKNQYMSGEEIARLLESLPAEAVANIEIIHNPSSRYDAEGNSGIINIRLKRNENLGYNGSISLSGRQGWNTNLNGSLLLNFRSSKANIYTNYSNYMWGNDNNLNLYRDIPFAGQNTIFDQESDMHFEGYGHNIRTGADFFVSDKTTVGVLFKANIGDRDQFVDNHTLITGGNSPGFDQLVVLSDGDSNHDQLSYNVNLKHSLNDNGSEISFDADYSTYSRPENIVYNNNYMDLNGVNVLNPSSLRNNNNINVNIFATQADYKGAINKVSLEAGAKFSSVETDNNTIFEDMVDGDWVENGLRTNQFVYQEDILAGYVNASTQLGKAMVQVGLRMENTSSDGHSVTLDQRVQRDYTNLFPSISLSHQIKDKHSLSYTFSRRLNRPNYRDLNPFIEYLDDYTFQKGNPFLQPQYANTFGINYGLGNSLFISANYSKTTDAMTEVIEQFSAENTTFQTKQNLDDFEAINVNVTMPIVISSKWTSRLSLTGFHHQFNSVIPSGQLNNNQTSFHFYMGNELSLAKGWRAEVTGWYQSALVWGLFELDPQYSMDLGFSKRVMNGLGSIKVGLNDVFFTLRNAVDVLQDDINLQVRQNRDSRRATLSFSYRFGNQKVKQARRRKTATEAEAGRIGGDKN